MDRGRPSGLRAQGSGPRAQGLERGRPVLGSVLVIGLWVCGVGPWALGLEPRAVRAQELVDKVVARVDGSALTLSDVRIAVALGIVQPAEDGGDTAAAAALVDRQLVLTEVARFVPPEPGVEAIEREMAVLAARTGGRLADVMAATGLDEARLREIARDSLRIEAYVGQRFGTGAQLTEEDVLQYYRIHPEEFMRDGRLTPFGEAEPAARERAASERRAATLAQWMRDLRARSEVVMVR